MNKPICEIICTSSAEHLTQIYTGFGLLMRQKLISLSITKGSDYKSGVTGTPKATVIVDGIRITYDTHDGEQVFQEELSSSDFYFKRSFNPDYVCKLREAHKVFPLGFNYPVYGPNDSSLRRCLWALGSIHRPLVLAQVVRSNGFLSRVFRTNGGRSTSSIEAFECEPSKANPCILFLARTWEPDRARTPDLMEERHSINGMRAECIRGLRREFGKMFVGGFSPSDYALRNYADCIVSPRLTRKREYLNIMRGASICVATMGLQKSNGWKLAEYIAGAKAILSERLHHTVPGDFRPNSNYLEFLTPQECVEQAHILVSDLGRRYEMMQSNYNYYHSYLRPDKLIWNTLLVATRA